MIPIITHNVTHSHDFIAIPVFIIPLPPVDII